MPNAWTDYLHKWAKEHNVSYMCALTDAEARKGYVKKSKSKKTPVAPVAPPPPPPPPPPPSPVVAKKGRGRPKKTVVAPIEPVAPPPPKKGRGRPKKAVVALPPIIEAVKKGRGRPKKVVEFLPPTPPPKKGRGRPKKIVIEEEKVKKPRKERIDPKPSVSITYGLDKGGNKTEKQKLNRVRKQITASRREYPVPKNPPPPRTEIHQILTDISIKGEEHQQNNDKYIPVFLKALDGYIDRCNSLVDRIIDGIGKGVRYPDFEKYKKGPIDTRPSWDEQRQLDELNEEVRGNPTKARKAKKDELLNSMSAKDQLKYLVEGYVYEGADIKYLSKEFRPPNQENRPDVMVFDAGALNSIVEQHFHYAYGRFNPYREEDDEYDPTVKSGTRRHLPKTLSDYKDWRPMAFDLYSIRTKRKYLDFTDEVRTTEMKVEDDAIGDPYNIKDLTYWLTHAFQGFGAFDFVRMNGIGDWGYNVFIWYGKRLKQLKWKGEENLDIDDNITAEEIKEYNPYEIWHSSDLSYDDYFDPLTKLYGLEGEEFLWRIPKL